MDNATVIHCIVRHLDSVSIARLTQCNRFINKCINWNCVYVTDNNKNVVIKVYRRDAFTCVFGSKIPYKYLQFCTRDQLLMLNKYYFRTQKFLYKSTLQHIFQIEACRIGDWHTFTIIKSFEGNFHNVQWTYKILYCMFEIIGRRGDLTMMRNLYTYIYLDLIHNESNSTSATSRFREKLRQYFITPMLEGVLAGVGNATDLTPYYNCITELKVCMREIFRDDYIREYEKIIACMCAASYYNPAIFTAFERGNLDVIKAFRILELGPLLRHKRAFECLVINNHCDIIKWMFAYGYGWNSSLDRCAKFIVSAIEAHHWDMVDLLFSKLHTPVFNRNVERIMHAIVIHGYPSASNVIAKYYGQIDTTSNTIIGSMARNGDYGQWIKAFELH